MSNCCCWLLFVIQPPLFLLIWNENDGGWILFVAALRQRTKNNNNKMLQNLWLYSRVKQKAMHLLMISGLCLSSLFFVCLFFYFLGGFCPLASSENVNKCGSNFKLAKTKNAKWLFLCIWLTVGFSLRWFFWKFASWLLVFKGDSTLVHYQVLKLSGALSLFFCFSLLLQGRRKVYHILLNQLLAATS